MSAHVFYPSPEMPDQIASYAAGLKTHHKEFGDVTGNAPSDHKELVAGAKKLEPIAQEIEDLQVQLAAKLDAYHKAASPLWAKFSECLGYARTFADKHDNAALKNFLLAFRHNAGRHAAKTAAGSASKASGSAPTASGT